MNGPTSTPTPSRPDEVTRGGEVDRARARAAAYHVIAEILLPPGEELAGRLGDGSLAADLDIAARVLGLGPAAALGAEAARRRGTGARALEQAHMDLFGPTVGTAHPPYSTEYDPDAGFRKEQELADIAGYYKAWGVGIADDLHERVDHFGVEADFLSFLAAKEAVALAADGPVDLVREAAARFACTYVLPAARLFDERLERAQASPLFLHAAALLHALAESSPEPARRRVVPLPVVS